jgi:hypothetical protein
LADHPGLEGRIRVRFTVGSKGQVTTSALDVSTMNNPTVACAPPLNARSLAARTVDPLNLPEPFVRHGSLSILAESSVESAIRDGRFRSTSWQPSRWSPAFLRIYRLRATHLGRFSTPHAEQLRAGILGLCAALERLPPECPIASCSLDLDDGRSIMLFERADTNALLGLLSMVDRRMVSEREWETLWGIPASG